MIDSGDRFPWLCRFGRGRSAQSEPLGVLLLLAITVIGTTAIVVFGGGAITDTEQSMELNRNEHTMTLLDSRGSMVALGDAESQRLSIDSSGDGVYRVNESSGWLRVRHMNFTESSDNETIYQSSLGAVTYENDGTTIAYEGGGVWRTAGNGTSMVSPPEFHYRDATLTLPIIQVTESSGSSTDGLHLVSAGQPHQVFPNVTAEPTDGTEIGAPYNGTNQTYVNPVENGTIDVTVHSEHYRGWAEYFRTRTEGTVSVDHTRKEATVELQTTTHVGDFAMPSEGNSVKVRGMNSGHNISNYTVSLTADGHFNNMHWSMYHDSPTTRFEAHIYSDSKCTGGTYGGTLDVSVYYWDGGTTYEGWQNSTIDPGTPGSGDDFIVDCSQSPAVLTANLTGDTPLTYKEIDTTGSDNKWYFGSEISDGDVEPSVTFDNHTVDPADPYDENNDAERVGFLVNHYFAVMSPDFELTVIDGPGGSERVDEGSSSGTLDYEASSERRFITFLHVTENEVEVRRE